MSNLLDPGRDLHPVGPDLGPKKLFANYYQQITKVTASKERDKLVPNILSTKSMGYWDIKKYKKFKILICRINIFFFFFHRAICKPVFLLNLRA